MILERQYRLLPMVREFEVSVKEDTRNRLSVTAKPPTRALLKEMSEETHISLNDLFTIGIDVLHFVWSVLRRGGVIGVKFPEDKEFEPVQIFIPRMTKPFA